jgi:hypothetical protein
VPNTITRPKLPYTTLQWRKGAMPIQLHSYACSLRCLAMRRNAGGCEIQLKITGLERLCG